MTIRWTKRLIIFIFSLTFGALGLSWQPNAVVAQELPRTHLKVLTGNTFMPAYEQSEKPFWTQTIPEHSNGQVTTDITSLNEMGLRGPEVMRLMKLGVIDFGTTIIGYLAGDDPAAEAVDLAGLSPSAETARKVAEAWKPVLDERFKEKHGIKVLAIWAYPGQVIFCKTPITGLSDLAGRKVRTGNRTLAEFVEALGASSVTMPFADVMPALQRGVMDCAITGTLTAYLQKWYQVVDYAYALTVGWSHMLHAVNLKTWERIDPSVREFLVSEIATLENEIWEGVDEQTSEGFNCLTGNGPCSYGEPANMTLVPVSAKDEEVLRQALVGIVVPKWAERCGEACAGRWNETIATVVGVKADLK